MCVKRWNQVSILGPFYLGIYVGNTTVVQHQKGGWFQSYAQEQAILIRLTVLLIICK